MFGSDVVYNVVAERQPERSGRGPYDLQDRCGRRSGSSWVPSISSTACPVGPTVGVVADEGSGAVHPDLRRTLTERAGIDDQYPDTGRTDLGGQGFADGLMSELR